MRPILLLVLLFIVGQWFVKALRRAAPQARPGAQPSGQPGQGTSRDSRETARAAALPEPMVRCAECGVHAPRSDSVLAGAQSFCCPEHARAYAARHPGSDPGGARDQDRAA